MVQLQYQTVVGQNIALIYYSHLTMFLKLLLYIFSHFELTTVLLVLVKFMKQEKLSH